MCCLWTTIIDCSQKTETDWGKGAHFYKRHICICICITGGSCNERCSYCLGTKCRECHYGWYGRHCNDKCSEYCWHGGCERITGRCHQCVPGRHSGDCTQLCSHHCRENSNGQVNCDITTGNCLEDCVEGRWGPRCQYRCPANCKVELCYKEDGGCLRGCVDRFHGSMCKDQCSEGCLNSTCQWFTAKCTHGCKTGYTGSKCSNPRTRHCMDPESYYIDEQSLVCEGGCKPGWTAAHCEDTCRERCETCHQFDKTCQQCQPGFYGEACQLECGMNCNQTHCDMSGRCDKGCMGGFRGEYCNETCPFNCLTCSQWQSTCTFCKQGYTGDQCLETTIPEVDPATDEGVHILPNIQTALLLVSVARIIKT
ncbi:multiple epidermal growth factor-like domains protein 10 isoform X1 [Haliotis rubra]|uniref:multiple epidermal growth factor-like domains protein 10 isoform X1 n=1 Tax=Haliotis rubra TaxID=36100 RepID=UPI001EE5DFCA|nr:multiple epidermal growth factor-like domains protein 10 isoform X1 [Haliotis rubra]